MYKAESRALTGHCTFGNSVYIEYCAMLQRQVVFRVSGGPIDSLFSGHHLYNHQHTFEICETTFRCEAPLVLFTVMLF